MARRCLTKVRRENILGEEVRREAPASAEVRVVVSKSIAAPAIGREKPFGRESLPETIREKLEVGDARLCYGENSTAHEHSPPDIGL